MVNQISPPPLTDMLFWHLGEEPRPNRQSRMRTVERRDQQYRLQWVWASNGKVPSNAVVANDVKGKRTFIGRAHYQGSVTPGFVDPKRAACCIVWGGEERKIELYEVLCTAGRFVAVSQLETNALLNASSAGISEFGEPLFIGRAQIKGSWVYGKVQRSHGPSGVCYIPFKGKELAFKEYEVFIGIPLGEDIHCWKPLIDQNIPSNANVGGFHERSYLYIGHSNHRGSCTPGMVSTVTKRCHIAWGGSEHRKAEFEILCNCRGKFVESKLGQVPVGAVLGGYSEVVGEPLFIGRVKVKESLIVGKVQPSHKVCYIPVGGKEVAFERYEVFVFEQYSK